MARKRPNIRKQITEAKAALKEIMQQELAKIAQTGIDQVMARAARLTDSRNLDAIKGIEWRGVLAYKDLLRTALSVIALDAIESARKQIPKAKSVKLAGADDSLTLSEFDRLPPSIKKKVQTQVNLVADAQLGDIEKAVVFQYTSSIDSTDSLELIRDDLESSVEDYLTGPAIEGGSGVQAAKFINESRMEFFQDPEVSPLFEAFEFVNGDPVTPICQDLDGTVFAKDDPGANRYFPPLHWNCKSAVHPVLSIEGKTVDPLKPSKASLEDGIQFSEAHACGCAPKKKAKAKRV